MLHHSLLRGSFGLGDLPWVEIDPIFLEAALELRGPTGIAPEVGVFSRTVRRNALRVGLVEPGAPVFQTQVNEQGVVQIIHRSTAPPISDISDEELDQLLASTLETFPRFGRRMIRGDLKSQGYRIPGERITTSYLRVHGVLPFLEIVKSAERSTVSLALCLLLTWTVSMVGVHLLGYEMVLKTSAPNFRFLRSNPLQDCHSLLY